MNVYRPFCPFILKSVSITTLVFLANISFAQYPVASEAQMQAGYELQQDDLTSGFDFDDGPVKPFAAVYRFSHRPSNTLLDEARLRVSPNGIRIDQIIDDTANTIIANFESDKLWFVDRARKLVHAVPLSVVPEETSVGLPAGESPMFGFLHFKVCESLSARYIEKKDKYGQLLEHWACISDGEIVEHQWFNRDYGVVVLSLTNDGFVNELVDLRNRQLNESYFIPPESYRSVSLEELLNDVAPIDSYIESTVIR